MDRTEILELWNRHHTDSTWITPWSKAVGGLTAAQAAWSPGGGRHSIWQLVHHIVFWREYHLSRKRGGETLPDALVQRRNWEQPAAVTEDAWKKAVERFNASHAAIAEAIADPGFPVADIPHLLTHDSYHTGQIMQLRAMQGMKPIE